MPIEFRCSHCGKLLRTGDDTVGRQAQCPECGALSQVPSPASSPNAIPPLAPLAAEKAEWTGPSDGGHGLLPAQRISGPATALQVTAILGILAQLLGILANLAQVGLAGAIPNRQPDEFVAIFSGGIGAAMGVFGILVGVFIFVGATKMKNLEYYPLAVASAVVAMIPCISPCCLLGLPFGIWTLIVLNDPVVKNSFRS